MEEVKEKINVQIRPGLTVQKIHDVVAQMRRNGPLMPVNDPRDPPREIIDIRLMEDGTVRTYLKDEPYPVRFFTPSEAINTTAGYKRLFSLLGKAGLPGLITIWYFRSLWPKWLHRLFELYPIPLKDDHWSQPVKEIRRVLDIDPDIKDAIALIFENDMAYRYRLQFFLQCINKENLQKNPIKELNTVLDIFISREKDVCLDLWKMFRKYSWILRIYGLKEVKAMLMEMNMDEIKMSQEDVYWARINQSFNFGG